MGCFRSRHVSRRVSSRSTRWLPFSLWAPFERVRHNSANRSARSDRLFVGSAPASFRKTQSLWQTRVNFHLVRAFE
jgi:hypothetical protein